MLTSKQTKMKAKISQIISCSVGLFVFISAAAQNSNTIYGGPLALPAWTTKNCQQWAKLFGEWNNERLSAMQPTADGGFVLAGHSDAAANNPLWILKTDANGTQQWNNNYTRPFYSEMRSLQQTADGGYILAGYTQTSNSDYDVWILKLNGSGNFQWQKTFGGTSRDEAYGISLTSDGGFIVAASTSSGDGDVLGGAEGGFNYWILKLDMGGNLQWQKKLEAFQRAYAVKQTTDGGYIIAGDSPTYFNLNANPDDPSDESAFNVIKVNSSGDFLWQVSLGTYKLDAAYDIIQSSDGNYVAAGYTNKFDPVTGDNFDGLVAKISPGGTLLWQSRVDYTFNDQIRNIRQTTSGGYVFGGVADYSWNNWYGNYDPSDYWAGTLDAAGQLLWQGAFGGEREGSAFSIVPTADGGYVVAGSYVVPGNMAMGISANADYLLIKLEPGCTIQQVSGYYKRRQYVPHWQVETPQARTRSGTALQLNNSTGPEVLFRDTLNRLIAAVSSGGAHPVGGNITASVWVDFNQPDTYLRRHYEITPDEDAAIATGTVKLFFSQEDFNAYNEKVSAERKLPATAGDAAGIANLRIVKYSGVSNGETGLPGSYTGNSTVIIPSEILWNNNQQIWEVSFDVSGFSGFFATDAITAGAALPVTFGTIDAFLKNGILTVNWTSKKETNNAYYLVEASKDGKHFVTISDKVFTKAKDGNSDIPLQYAFTKSYIELQCLALLFLSLSITFKKRKPLWLLSFIIMVCALSVLSCRKNGNDTAGNSDQKIYIRVVQVDADGQRSYSKVITAIQQ